MAMDVETQKWRCTNLNFAAHHATTERVKRTLVCWGVENASASTPAVVAIVEAGSTTTPLFEGGRKAKSSPSHALESPLQQARRSSIKHNNAMGRMNSIRHWAKRQATWPHANMMPGGLVHPRTTNQKCSRENNRTNDHHIAVQNENPHCGVQMMAEQPGNHARGQHA